MSIGGLIRAQTLRESRQWEEVYEVSGVGSVGVSKLFLNHGAVTTQRTVSAIPTAQRRRLVRAVVLYTNLPNIPTPTVTATLDISVGNRVDVSPTLPSYSFTQTFTWRQTGFGIRHLDVLYPRGSIHMARGHDVSMSWSPAIDSPLVRVALLWEDLRA